MANKRWTDDEVFFLKESYADVKWRFKDICNTLGRSASSVDKKGKSLGIVNITPSNYPVPEGTKMCRRCHEIKPFSKFYRHKSNKDGFNTYCGQCCKDILNEKKINEIKLKLDEKEQKRQAYIDSFKGKPILCTKCKTHKDIEEFSVAFKHDTIKRHHWCKKCSAKKQQELTIKKLQEKGHV